MLHLRRAGESRTTWGHLCTVAHPERLGLLCPYVPTLAARPALPPIIMLPHYGAALISGESLGCGRPRAAARGNTYATYSWSQLVVHLDYGYVTFDGVVCVPGAQCARERLRSA